MEIEGEVSTAVTTPAVEAPPEPEAPAPGLAGAVNMLMTPAAPAAPVSTTPVNIANRMNSDAYKFVRDEVIPLVSHVRMGRRGREEEWLEIDRMDNMEHDSNQKYIGKSKAYLPVANNNFNTIVAALMRGFFPSDDFCDVVSRDESGNAKAKNVKALIQWSLEAQLRREMKSFLRQFAKYGTAAMKYLWKTPKRGKGMFCVSTRNLFNWYIYPQTTASIDEAVMVFEDVDVPRHFLEEKMRDKAFHNVNQALAAGPRKLDDKDAERMERSGDTEISLGTLSEMYRLTEVWTYMKLPKDVLGPDKDPECPYVTKIILCNDIILEISGHPYIYEKIPYVDYRSEIEPGIFYGRGFGKRARPFQYLTNDFANQTNDNGIYALNPIAIMNPSYMAQTPKPLAPGVTLYMTDITQGIRFERPPAEQVQMGMQMMNMYMTQGQSMGGAPPVLQGGKAEKTATGTQILQRNALAPLQDLVEDGEQSFLIPLMIACWRLSQQFMQEEVMAVVAGEAIKVTPEDLQLNAEFRWLASNQAMNAQQRAQQGIQMLQALTPPVLQQLMQAGYIVDPAPLLRRVYTDGLGFRGFDQFIKPAPQMPGMPPGMPGAPAPGMPPGMPPGGAPMPEGDRVRSALEQVTGAAEAPPMVPGEGEDFGEVRAGADEMAALLGGQ
jgi:hypothetical protein